MASNEAADATNPNATSAGSTAPAGRLHKPNGKWRVMRGSRRRRTELRAQRTRASRSIEVEERKSRTKTKNTHPRHPPPDLLHPARRTKPPDPKDTDETHSTPERPPTRLTAHLHHKRRTRTQNDAPTSKTGHPCREAPKLSRNSDAVEKLGCCRETRMLSRSCQKAVEMLPVNIPWGFADAAEVKARQHQRYAHRPCDNVPEPRMPPTKRPKQPTKRVNPPRRRGRLKVQSDSSLGASDMDQRCWGSTLGPPGPNPKDSEPGTRRPCIPIAKICKRAANYQIGQPRGRSAQSLLGHTLIYGLEELHSFYWNFLIGIFHSLILHPFGYFNHIPFEGECWK
ncbi:hypothetical protein BU15DRAFT_68878 [Melanogaster broomeanus]|nr:hypothetical protein BU15DRAFT_68878 [Melanogaster broomeanus]